MGTMRKGWIKLSVYACSITLLLGFFVQPVLADEVTIMSVISSESVVSGSETFSVGIYCTPGEPMKAFELSVSFDETRLHANSVSEGDIFEGYSTFFNSGTIDNNNGVITSIYNLIIGSGNVTTAGYLVNISFTSLDVTGSTQITISDAGVTNEIIYLPLSVVNGSVIIDATTPVVTDQSPSTGTTGDSFTFNVSVSDTIDESSDITAKVHWSHSGNGANTSMVYVGGGYFEKTVTLAQSTSAMTYRIYVEDTTGNSFTTALDSVSVIDNDKPSLISDTSSGSGSTGDSYRWFVNLSDNINSEGSLTVKVNLANGSLSGNSSMSYTGSYWTYAHALDHSLSSMTYSIYDRDSAGNILYVSWSHSPVSVSDNDVPTTGTPQASPSSQTKDGSVNLSCAITDNIALSTVYLLINYPDSSSINISVFSNRIVNTFYSLRTYSMLGVYSFSFWAQDSSGNAKRSSTQTFSITDTSSPVISNIQCISSNPQDTDPSFGWVNISCMVSDDDLSQTRLIYTNPLGTPSNISMVEKSGNIFYYNTSSSIHGNYSYSIWSVDTYGNSNSTSVSQYCLPPNYDVNNDGMINVFDFTMISNQYGDTGVFGWIREDVDNNGEVNILDIVLSANQYLDVWWT